MYGEVLGNPQGALYCHGRENLVELRIRMFRLIAMCLVVVKSMANRTLKMYGLLVQRVLHCNEVEGGRAGHGTGRVRVLL